MDPPPLTTHFNSNIGFWPSRSFFLCTLNLWPVWKYWKKGWRRWSNFLTITYSFCGHSTYLLKEHSQSVPVSGRKQLKKFCAVVQLFTLWKVQPGVQAYLLKCTLWIHYPNSFFFRGYKKKHLWHFSEFHGTFTRWFVRIWVPIRIY